MCEKLEVSDDDPHAAIHPKLVVEVLSDSTEGYDRGVKAAHYRPIASLEEYVFVSQRERRIEVHRKNERGLWELAVEVTECVAELASVGARLDVDAVCANPLGG